MTAVQAGSRKLQASKETREKQQAKALMGIPSRMPFAIRSGCTIRNVEDDAFECMQRVGRGWIARRKLCPEGYTLDVPDDDLLTGADFDQLWATARKEVGRPYEDVHELEHQFTEPLLLSWDDIVNTEGGELEFRRNLEQRCGMPSSHAKHVVAQITALLTKLRNSTFIVDDGRVSRSDEESILASLMASSPTVRWSDGLVASWRCILSQLDKRPQLFW